MCRSVIKEPVTWNATMNKSQKLFEWLSTKIRMKEKQVNCVKNHHKIARGHRWQHSLRKPIQRLTPVLLCHEILLILKILILWWCMCKFCLCLKHLNFIIIKQNSRLCSRLCQSLLEIILVQLNKVSFYHQAFSHSVLTLFEQTAWNQNRELTSDKDWTCTVFFRIYTIVKSYSHMFIE